MEDFANLLQRDYGLKPQGKMAPMSASKASSSTSSAPELVSKPKGNRSARTSLDDQLFFNTPRTASFNDSSYNDVFGGPPKFTSSSSPVYDDIFRTKPAPAHSHSASRDDSLPVFDEDIFRGVPGTRSSASNVAYDNVFGTAASASGSVSDDLLGGYRSNHHKPPKAYESSSTYDDDLLGIGSNHQTQSKASEPTANYDDELLPDLGTSRNSSRSAEPTPVDTSDAAEVDPFANIQPNFSSVPPHVADPLDPLGSFTNDSTSNGVSDGLGDFDMFSNSTVKSSIRRQSSEPKSVRQNFKQVDPEPELDTSSPEKGQVDSGPSEGFEQFTEPANQEVKETWLGVEDVRLVTEPTRTPPPSRLAPGFGYENSARPPPAYESANNTRPPPAYENVRTPPPAYENVRTPPPAYENVRTPPPAYENVRTPPPAYENARAPPAYENVNSYDEQEDYEAKAKMKKEREYRRMKEREEEERQKEEKERQRRAVEKITRETRERLAAQAREKAQKIAVEKASAEARERLAEEARRRAEEARQREEERQRREEERQREEARQREQEAREARAAVERVNQQVRQRAAQRAAEQLRQQQQQQQERRETQHRANDDFDFFSRPSSAPRQRPPEASKGSEKAAPVKKVSSVSGIDQLSDVLGMSSDNTDNFKRNVARRERDMRTEERARRALEEKKKRDLDFQMEQAEKHRASEQLDADIKRWAAGKEQNIRAMLSTLQYVLWPECGWQPVSLTDLIQGQSVKKAYRKATLMLHPDKVQQKGATVQQKYIAEKVFDLLKEAWNKFNSEELF